MKSYPRTITEEKRNRLEQEYDKLERVLLEEIETFLSRIELEPIRNHLHETVFLSNAALPKQADRPHTTAPLLAQTVYSGLTAEDSPQRDLLRFAVAVQEYYDVFDDLLDDDVVESHWQEVFVAHETMVPMLSDEISKLGDDAEEYWSNRAIEMMTGPYTEILTDPDPELYLEIVDHQSMLYGFVTGLAAVAADASEREVSNAERLGRLFFKLHQFALDLNQYPSDDDPWNVWKLLSETDATNIFYNYQEGINGEAGNYLGESATDLRLLAAIDIEAMKPDAGL